MTRWRRGAAGCLLGLGLLLGELPAAGQEEACVELSARLEARQEELAGDLRRIHREIAALRAEMESPGLGEIFAGVGYILGLFGVACFVAARRR